MSFQFTAGDYLRLTGGAVTGPTDFYGEVVFYGNVIHGSTIYSNYYSFQNEEPSIAPPGRSVYVNSTSHMLTWKNNAGTSYTLAITDDIVTHAALTTGVHGVGASTILSAATAAATYLPLAGGTMAGVLNLTSATMTAKISGAADNATYAYCFSLTANAGPSIVGNAGDAGYPGYMTFYYGDNRSGKTPTASIIFYYLANSGAGGQTWEIDKSGNVTMTGMLTITANAAKTVVLKPPQYTTANAPTSTAGNVYFDTTLNKLRIRGAAGWETVTSV